MARIRAGGARVDVTPDGPVPMSGYGAREDHSTGVHDPLGATSLVVSDGASTVGILSVDLLNVSRELTTRVRRRLGRTDADIDTLLLAATHTHTGPYMPAPAIDVNPSLSVDEDVSDVLDTVTHGCVESLVTAHAGLEPASIRVGRAQSDSAPVNRRAQDGWSRCSGGRVDPELVVLDVQTASGEEVIVFNFAMHPVCLTPSDTELSADWPAVVYERVAETHDGAVVMFLNGAAGDVNPRGRTATSGRGEGSFDHVEEIGGAVAETALEALSAAGDTADFDDTPITTASRQVNLPVKPTGDPEQLRAHRDNLEAKLGRLEDAENTEALPYVREELKHATERLHLAEWNATHLPATLQYVEIGTVGLLGMPGEVFVEHGLELKSRASVDTLLPVGYAGGYVGYIPPLRELENVGYEVWTTKVAPEALATFRDAAFDLATDP